MLDRGAHSVDALRIGFAAGLIALAATGSVMVTKLDSHAPHDARATVTLVEAVRGEICAFALAMPTCWHTMVCVDTLEWIGGTDEVVVGPPVIRARSLGLTPSYLLRQRDVPPLALPR